LDLEMKIFIYSALLIGTSFTFTAAANEQSSAEMSEELQQELAALCEYYPNECPVTTTGAGNGGGNEPPLGNKSKLK
jgi:hypothetical protein